MASRTNHSARGAHQGPVSSRESACAALGIPVYATEAEGKKAYRSLARAFHPDKGGDVARFQAVQRAHEFLTAAWGRDREDRRRAAVDARAKAEKRTGYGGGFGFVKRGQNGAASGSGSASAAQQPLEASEGTAASVSEAACTSPDNNTGSSPTTAVPVATTAATATASLTAASTAVAQSRDLKQLGDEALASGDFLRAVECFDAALRSGAFVSAAAAVHYARGCAYAGLAEWGRALLDADKAVALRGLWLAPRVLRGRALEAARRWAAAGACYGAAEEIINSSNNRGSSRSGGDGGGEADEVSSVVEGLRRTQEALAMRSCVAAMSGHQAAVTTVAFMPAAPASASPSYPPSSVPTTCLSSRTQKFVASASNDGTVRVWEIPSGECRLVLHASSPSSLACNDPVYSLAWGLAPLHRDVDERREAEPAESPTESRDESPEAETTRRVQPPAGQDGCDAYTWCLAATTVSGALTLWHIRVSSLSPLPLEREHRPTSRVIPTTATPPHSPLTDLPVEVTVAAERRLIPPGGAVTALAFDAPARQLASGFAVGGCVVW